MPKLARLNLWLLAAAGAAAVFLASTPVAAAADDVFLQFYMDQVKLWEQQGQQSKLQGAILPGLQAYCSKAANLDTCGLNGTIDVNFTTSHIVVSPGYPVNYKNRYMNVRLKISYAVGSNTVQLPVGVVTEIVQNQRETVSNDVGFHLFLINDVMYLPPPPVMANKVLVPMFVLGTLVLIIVALALKHMRAREYRLHLRKYAGETHSQRKNSRVGSNKVGASANDLTKPDVEDRTGKRNDKSHLNGEKKKKRKKKTADAGGDKNNGKGIGGKGEFNNIGFDKSINEGDPRARQSEAVNAGDGGDSSGDPRASQSALSEVIQVRADSSPKTGAADQSNKKGKAKKNAAGQRGKHTSSGSHDGGVEKSVSGKKTSTSSGDKDAEEVMLMDAGVFNPPEVNVSGDRSDSGDDDVPTLRDSSIQQMI